jgi:hypothetical protein
MTAFHDQATHQMRNRLEFTVRGLGLVRLLQDAGRIYEARTTLSCLENGFKGVAEKSKKPNRESLTATGLKGITRRASRSLGSGSAKIKASKMRMQGVSAA